MSAGRAPLVMLAAGGTGGHMFPAAAAARALLARGRRVLLLTDKRGAGHVGALDGAELRLIPAGGIAGRGLVQRASAAIKLGLGFFAARRIIAGAQPDAVLGFGGYGSLSGLAAALFAGLPTAIHEQNAVLGRANRLLAPRVRVIATSFAATKGLDAAAAPRVTVTGNPVRPEIVALAARPYAAPALSEPFRLLVLGGSQGAHAFAKAIPAAIGRLDPAQRARLRLTQQARPEDVETVRAVYRALGIAAEVESFFQDVPQRLAEAHLLVSRSGASTVAEIAAAGRPAILVPYPHAIDDHQRANAEALAQGGGAWVMPEDAFSAEGLAARLAQLMDMPAMLAQAAGAARQAGRPDAAERLADLVERLLPSNGDHAPLREAAE
jgi:UDP-N-acetylglucosamine--N-acetylmuramyl-(pentapeptide) pyrophosphoryl-undecaprenol N-acetylglucosamine transferase